MGLFIRLLICIVCTGIVLYKYIDKHNELTGLMIYIPAEEKELKEIREKNLELHYEIEQFESPIHLMEMANKPEFGHLEHPSIQEIIFLPEAVLLQPKQMSR